MSPANDQESDAGARALFATVEETVGTAARRAGGFIDRHFRLAGHGVLVRFAGPVLVSRTTPALEHLAVDPEPAPAFTVLVGDTLTLGAEPPWTGLIPTETLGVDALWRLNTAATLSLPSEGEPQ